MAVIDARRGAGGPDLGRRPRDRPAGCGPVDPGDHGGEVPLTERPLVLVLTTSVVVATLVVQGFTLAPVVRRSGIALEPDHTEREEAEPRCGLANAGLSRLEEIADIEAVPEVVLDRLRRSLTARADDARDRLAQANGAGWGRVPERIRSRSSA